jgi:hypothetical protein
MKISFTLQLAAVCAFIAMPAFAQHGNRHGAGGGMPSSSSNSSHGNSADAKADKGSFSNGSSVPEKLTDNTKLAAKLQGLLPASTNLQTAAQGFKNLGQFAAAVHVAKNLGIPFDQLKTKMMGPPKESLGKAIHDLKPAANSREEARKAEKQAKRDMDDTGKAS